MSISRIDSKSTHGWFVRVARGSKKHETKKEFNAFLSDSLHGGGDSALEMARETERELLLGYPRIPFRLFPLSTNTTGVCGVSYTYKRGRRNRNVLYWGYSVLYKTADGFRTTRFFSISKYGANALREAVRFRKNWEAEQLQLIKTAVKAG